MFGGTQSYRSSIHVQLLCFPNSQLMVISYHFTHFFTILLLFEVFRWPDFSSSVTFYLIVQNHLMHTEICFTYMVLLAVTYCKFQQHIYTLSLKLSIASV
jgi:hypothetical protein